ncbi:MAG: PKD domain-containing protein [Flavobacteriales bacterium]|nr:PKD domain-containing protein [Flavobacteriales bacterium]
MNRSLRTLLLSTPLLGVLAAHGQLYDGSPRAAGPPCDSALVVDFSVVDNGLMSYSFIPAIDTGGHTILGQTWNYLNIVPLSNPNPSFTEQFFATGPTPVCLTVDALDQQSQQCSTTACKVVTIYADSICSTLNADFTITNIQDSTVTFGELSTFAGNIGYYSWNFGDAALDVGPTPTHTFTGNGPFEVCLTVFGADTLDLCSNTICKWLYLGPGNVPCSTLLQQGFLAAVVDNTVGVLDTSITTGMYSEISWDFGDGSMMAGPVAYHTYDFAGIYEVCETISLWGPLTPDTCVSTLCTSVYAAAVGVTDVTGGSPLRAWPNPSEGTLWVDGLPSGVKQLELSDLAGRVVRTFLIGSEAVHRLDVSDLRPGLYFLHTIGAPPLITLRIVLN